MAQPKSKSRGVLGRVGVATRTLIAVVGVLGCFTCGGGDAGLSGSQCSLVDCKYDELICDLYASPNDFLKIYYKRNIEGGSEYTAILTIDLTGIDQVAGLELQNQEFVERVDIFSVGMFDKWPGHHDGSLEIRSEVQVGQKLDGKASFSFDNGRFLTAQFSCTLTEPN